MRAVIEIIKLDRPKLLAANALLRGDLYSIYFSADRKEGVILHPKNAMEGDEVTLTEGPTKIIGHGRVKSVG
jgi:hypothetical protein